MLNQTLAWHLFNYSIGQCSVLPASAAAHLAALKCFSQEGILINYCQARSVGIVLCHRTGCF